MNVQHSNPNTQDFSLGSILLKDWDVLRPELDKCDLVCANCHRIRHVKAGVIQRWRNKQNMGIGTLRRHREHIEETPEPAPAPVVEGTTPEQEEEKPKKPTSKKG